MTTAMLTNVMPVKGVADGKAANDPEVRQRWLDQRAGGLTATDIRDWGNGSRRREIIASKITGQSEDLNHIAAVAHGNRREPIIAEWIEQKFGIAPCDNVYSHGENPRHLASPDGVSLDPFTGALLVGGPDAALSEIKTSKHDLHPGKLDASRTLVEVDPESQFARTNYYTQIQWQMYVMNASRCLFVWEQHNGKIDPETDTFTPVGPPEYAWIPRDQQLIDVLVGEIAPKALAEIDAARATATVGELPPAGDLPSEHAMLMAELFKARDAEAIAKRAKDAAWKRLQEFYMSEDREDVSIRVPGLGSITTSTTERLVDVVDMDAARRRAPKLTAQYEALIKRYTKKQTKTNRTMTVVPEKKAREQ